MHQCRRHQSLVHSAFRKISQTSRRRSLTYVDFGEIQGKPNRAFGLNKQTYMDMVAHSHTTPWTALPTSTCCVRRARTDARHGGRQATVHRHGCPRGESGWPWPPCVGGDGGPGPSGGFPCGPHSLGRATRHEAQTQPP